MLAGSSWSAGVCSGLVGSVGSVGRRWLIGLSAVWLLFELCRRTIVSDGRPKGPSYRLSKSWLGRAGLVTCVERLPGVLISG